MSKSNGTPNTPPVTVERFTRTVLDETFGGAFSKKGFKNSGYLTGLVRRSSPAVIAGFVKVKDNDQIDQRGIAVKEGLVVVDEDGDVIKSESVLCQTLIEYTATGKVSKSSAAVEEKLVKLTKDGMIDRNSSAVKNEWIRLDNDGHVIEDQSILCHKVELIEKHGSHILGFEVADYITQVGGLVYTRQVAERMVLAINEDRNVRMKTREGNMKDRRLDGEIMDALKEARTQMWVARVALSSGASERAGRIAYLIFTEDYPVEFKTTARACFARLKDQDGFQIASSNTSIRTLCEGAEQYCAH